MIDLGSIAGLYEREHELHAYCHRCDRWSVLDLGRMVRAGQGSRRLPHGTLSCVRRGGSAAGATADADLVELERVDRI